MKKLKKIILIGLIIMVGTPVLLIVGTVFCGLVFGLIGGVSGRPTKGEKAVAALEAKFPKEFAGARAKAAAKAAEEAKAKAILEANATAIREANAKVPHPAVVYQSACRIIEKHLKAPTTAKWPYSTADGVAVMMSSNRFAVSTYVDSQNSFGAMIRSQCLLAAELSPDGTTLVPLFIRIGNSEADFEGRGVETYNAIGRAVNWRQMPR